ncbi:MAG TPA: methionine adenosyltransferase [Brevundimonas sp.]|jgi:S-adenosylmethionine synthetase|uniref:methionine adenosyltransferase n=1 Tax=Brevundimonas sp. TaxID=1871086 RepID=UPI002E167742|nr:methionine adenosyltransferase [Brevundimonas sp.]
MNRISIGRLAPVTGLFTSESVSDGHPDKIADQLSDAVLDAALALDPTARVAVEAGIKGSSVWLFGELSGHGLDLDFEEIVRDVLISIGHGGDRWGLDVNALDVRTSISRQSEEIRTGVDGGTDTGAGDQGMMFGYATRETPERLPTPIALAHRLIRRQREVRDRLGLLGPDAKAQVSARYENGRAVGLQTIVLSSQHVPELSLAQVRELLREEVVRPVLGEAAAGVELLLNPVGTFIEGGPVADAGLTGRKIIADTYGGFARHGGGAFSGKDGTKVDRSGAYAARQLALSLLEAHQADACEVRLAYAIGVAEPVAIHLDLAGGGGSLISDESQARLLGSLRPRSIIERLGLEAPGFRATASFGHFGRDKFTWERPEVEALLGVDKSRTYGFSPGGQNVEEAAR